MNSWLLGYVATLVVIVQFVAWIWRQNGQVFALTSLVLGGVITLAIKPLNDKVRGSV